MSLILITGLIAAGALLSAILFLVNFYRDPERRIPRGNNIVSPADGIIIRIVRTDKSRIRIEKGLLGKIDALAEDVAKECHVVSIFMNPFDVHVNRAPIEGIVESAKHSKGRFFAAYDMEKSLMNENNEIIIRNRSAGRIKVIQIAGFLARRIICSVKRGEKVNKGQRIGKIVLGSQVTMIMDSRKCTLKARKGQKVKAGVSIIAECR